MKNSKKIISAVLAAALVFTGTAAGLSFGTVTAEAATKQTVQMVTKAVNNSGDNIKYTYNKKGLVTKAVSKSSWKDDDSNTSDVATTVYKYNKKNRIATETTTDVQTKTSYKTNKTTGKRTGQKLGTVKTTTKSVTKYTYNKKGLATKAVTTTTTTKSGSVTRTDTNRSLYNDGELKDGRIIAGYNNRKADGSYWPEETQQNAYYYSGDVAKARRDVTTTTTYKDNGNGTYTVTEVESTSKANYETTEDADYYKWDSDEKAVAGTESDHSWSVIKGVKVTLTGTSNNTSKSTSVNTYTDKTVTTTKYSYDKKKRAKAATITTVKNYKKDNKYSYDSTSYSKGSDYTYTDKYASSDSSSYASTTTSTATEKYTYNKKNQRTKMTHTDKGIANSVVKETDGLYSYSENETYNYTDGTTETHNYNCSYTSGAGCDSVTTTTIKNGKRTKAVTYNPYTENYSSSHKYQDGSTSSGSYKYNYAYDKDSDSYKNMGSATGTAYTKTNTRTVPNEPESYTVKYKYDKSGNLKSAKTSGKNTVAVTLRNETYGNTIYEYDSAGEAVASQTTVKHSYTSNRTKENTVKSGTTRLKNSLSMSTYSSDTEKPAGYSLDGRVVYTIKAKKFSKKQAADAELQQWMLQNGALNGIVGL